jgi:lysophospholipase L1-like esterase
MSIFGILQKRSGWKIQAAALGSLAVLMVVCLGSNPATQPTDPAPAFQPNMRILFQGDSITDMNRGRTDDPNHILGHSYAFLIAAKYGCDLPERHLVFINRGVSGNKVTDLQKRWQTDTLDLQPDLLSILIGVNDLNANISADDYEKHYDQLLDQTTHALPSIRLVLCEPFGLPVGKYKDNWNQRKADLAALQKIVQKLGDKYHATVVHLQTVFDEACKKAPADYWIWDGVHPTYSGQQLVANEWVRTVNASTGK